jgi:hypothetical protein
METELVNAGHNEESAKGETEAGATRHATIDEASRPDTADLVRLISAIGKSLQDEDGTAKDCTPIELKACAGVMWAPQPEAIVPFRQPIMISEMPVILGDDVEHQAELRFGCNPFARNGVRAHLAIDVNFEQHWHYRELLLSSLSTTVSLAPNEELKITLRNTQRKYLDRLNVEQVEQAQERESTFVDKDVLNVTRSSSRTSNWNIGGNGSFTKKGLNLGLSGSFSETYNEQASASAEHVQESTVKSAENLKTLQKTEVREITETTQENTHARTITNPYSDRSLRLNVFNLAKRYCVEFRATALRPVILFELLRMRFDRSFVLANGSFLTEALLDSGLRYELSQALEAVSQMQGPDVVNKLQQRALMALRYLYAEPNIFNIPNPGDGPDMNLPESSFQDIPSSVGSTISRGLQDALDNKLGVVFTVLAMYYDIYRKEVALTNNGELALNRTAE